MNSDRVGEVSDINTTVYAVPAAHHCELAHRHGRVTLQQFSDSDYGCQFSLHLRLTSKQAFELAELLKAAALIAADTLDIAELPDRHIREAA